jgi:hypothetical protein
VLERLGIVHRALGQRVNAVVVEAARGDVLFH